MSKNFNAIIDHLKCKVDNIEVSILGYEIGSNELNIVFPSSTLKKINIEEVSQINFIWCNEKGLDMDNEALCITCDIKKYCNWGMTNIGSEVGIEVVYEIDKTFSVL